MMHIQQSVNFDWLLNTQSRVLHADWFILEISEKASLSINMPYCSKGAKCSPATTLQDKIRDYQNCK